MSITVALAFVATVAILAGLCAYAIRQLAGNRTAVHPHDDACCSLYLHESHSHRHSHYQQYASVNHNHDGVYSYIDHNHDDRYVTQNEYDQHEHTQYVTRDELNAATGRTERHVTLLHTMIIDFVTQSPQGILLGMLFGGVIGAIVGIILDITLPRRFFETDATTTFHVNGQDIVQHMTSHSVWPMYGIVLGCIIVGAILGGIILAVAGRIRNRSSIEN